MRETGEGGERQAVTYCIVPRELAAKLHDPLRRHFRDHPRIEVVVENRWRERRTGEQRRTRTGAAAAPTEELRRIRSETGRRAGERRATLVEVEAPDLPRAARRHADLLTFVERLEPSGLHSEDLDSARVVAAFQAGDSEVFGTLYMRYFDRVYAYLRVALSNEHRAEDAAQEVFMKAFEALPRYERRTQPFRAWLFVIVRNQALGQLAKDGRIDPVDPAELSRRQESEPARAGDPLDALHWISDRELLLFIERLPESQRQALLLKYMLDLSNAEIGRILGRTQPDVRRLQHRALRFLEDRLTAVGRSTTRGAHGIRMRRWRKQAVVLRRRRNALAP